MIPEQIAAALESTADSRVTHRDQRPCQWSRPCRAAPSPRRTFPAPHLPRAARSEPKKGGVRRVSQRRLRSADQIQLDLGLRHCSARSCNSTAAVSKRPDRGGDHVSNPDQISSDLGFRRCSARSYFAASRTAQIAIWIAFRLPSSRGDLGPSTLFHRAARARSSSTPPSVGSWLSALLRARSSDASPLHFRPPFPPPLRRVSDVPDPVGFRR
ncbi:hypothetical protein VNO78_34428 [Psophocarpus tetragonolobus]|uniref:Uncharacterized protein n=1 Tax=Psophocarpus tetragonolobus TaxID=3891 RepID=A0AAN9NZT1_PSOTE